MVQRYADIRKQAALAMSISMDRALGPWRRSAMAAAARPSKALMDAAASCSFSGQGKKI
jgi:hypothetical protein